MHHDHGPVNSFTLTTKSELLKVSSPKYIATEYGSLTATRYSST